MLNSLDPDPFGTGAVFFTNGMAYQILQGRAICIDPFVDDIRQVDEAVDEIGE